MTPPPPSSNHKIIFTLFVETLTHYIWRIITQKLCLDKLETSSSCRVCTLQVPHSVEPSTMTPWRCYRLRLLLLLQLVILDFVSLDQKILMHTHYVLQLNPARALHPSPDRVQISQFLPSFRAVLLCPQVLLALTSSTLNTVLCDEETRL